jgi:hypothetical protein
MAATVILSQDEKLALRAVFHATRSRDEAPEREIARGLFSRPDLKALLRQLKRKGLVENAGSYWSVTPEGASVFPYIAKALTRSRPRRSNPVQQRKRKGNPSSKFLGIPWWGWLIGVGAGLVYLTMRSATSMISSVAQTSAAAPQLPASSDGYGTYGRY